MDEYVSCYRIKDSAGNKIIVKGNLDQWIDENNLKWKEVNGEKRLYAGKRRCYIEELSPEIMMSMQYIFNDKKYDPTTIN